MNYVKPVPVKKDELIIGNQYYTCSYSGVIKVTLLKIFLDTQSVLVKVGSKKKELKPFVRSMRYIFDNPDMAKFAGREWGKSRQKKR